MSHTGHPRRRRSCLLGRCYQCTDTNQRMSPEMVRSKNCLRARLGSWFLHAISGEACIELAHSPESSNASSDTWMRLKRRCRGFGLGLGFNFVENELQRLIPVCHFLWDKEAWKLIILCYILWKRSMKVNTSCYILWRRAMKGISHARTS